MKIVLLSDTHGQLPWIPKGEYDLLLHAGDCCCYGTEEELEFTNNWFKIIQERIRNKIIYVPGNHDRIFESNEKLARKTLSAAKVLINEGVEINGLKIWGSPYTPEFCNWAFMMHRNDLDRVWAKIPEGLDILITHGGPNGILDRNNAGENCGCEALKERLVHMKKPPKFHLFGHIHEARGEKSLGNTKMFNASNVGAGNWPLFEAMEIEI